MLMKNLKSIIGYFGIVGFISLVTVTESNANWLDNPAKRDIKFKKTTLTSTFISEGVAAGDLNNDGVTDIIAGAKWFQGPDWTPRDIYKEERVFDGTKGYSNSML